MSAPPTPQPEPPREKRPPKDFRFSPGDELNCTVVQSLGGRRFAVTCHSTPHGWMIELQASKPKAIRLGDHSTFWIARLNPLTREILVRDGDFGRLPISPNMRVRYFEAFRSVLYDNVPTPEAVAETKSVFQKCIRQDQADWLSVYRLLGCPSLKSLQQGVENLTALRDAMKEGSPVELLARLRQGWADRVSGALQTLETME